VPGLPGKLSGLLGIQSSTPTSEPLATEPTPGILPPSDVPALTFTPTILAPALTFTPVRTPTLAATDIPTVTFTPSPTPQGGGYGQYAFVSDRTGAPQIYLANMADGTTQPLTNIVKGACQPAWSPNGLKLAFTSPCGQYDDDFKNSTIFLMNADGTDIVPLLNDPGGDFDPAWSPDGKRVAFVSIRKGRPQIFMAEVATNTIIPLIEPASDIEEMRYPAWSPFGNQLAYAAKRYGVFQIWTMSDTGDGQEQIVRSGLDFLDTHPLWSLDGTTVWFSERRLGAGGKYYLMNIRLEDRGTEGSRLDYGRLPILNIHFSPDGFWMIFEGEDEEGNRDIFIMTASGGNRTRLTVDPGMDFDPAWRPIQSP
jgi:Tol biopolymer transport system component